MLLSLFSSPLFFSQKTLKKKKERKEKKPRKRKMQDPRTRGKNHRKAREFQGPGGKRESQERGSVAGLDSKQVNRRTKVSA
jgi:hypothetical protein